MSLFRLIRDTLRAALIISRAFSTGAVATVVFLAQLLSVVSAGNRHVHLTRNRLGVFVLLPKTPASTLLRFVAFFLGLCLPALLAAAYRYLWSGNALVELVGFGLSACLVLWLIAGMTLMARQGGVALDARGLPEGKLYILSALAQIPGSNSGVLADLRTAISTLPSGSLVAGGAANETMALRYEKLGFTRESGLQLFLQL